MLQNVIAVDEILVHISILCSGGVGGSAKMGRFGCMHHTKTVYEASSA